MPQRKQIPSEIVTQVLVNSARRCCLCFGLNGDFSQKRGQIAHLDHDPGNFNFDNLAFLCLDHHDQYDSKTSQSKGLTIKEVKHYRSRLYETVDLYKTRNEQREIVTEKTDSLHILPRIRSGKELVEIARDAHAYRLNYDEPATEEEARLLGSFLSNVKENCEDLGCLDPGYAVDLAFGFNSAIEELEQNGFKVFGKREWERIENGNDAKWDVATLTVIRADNQSIIDLDEIQKLIEQIKAEDTT